MNAGMKDFANSMSKLLNLGSSLADVVRMSTWNPASEIKRPQLGNLDVGSDADSPSFVSIVALSVSWTLPEPRAGNQRLTCEMTLRGGKVMWDLNGRASLDWEKFPYQKQTWTQH